MKTIENILKEEVLKVTGGIPVEHTVSHDGIINAIKRYAMEIAIQTQINCAKNSTVKSIERVGGFYDYIVDKESIMDEDNIPKFI